MAERKLTFYKIRRYLWPVSLWKRVLVLIAATFIFFTTASYTIAQRYIAKHRSEPLTLGTTFVAPHAESFGLNPHETLNAILGDLKIFKQLIIF